MVERLCTNQYTTIKSGLGTITDITHAGDGSQRIFVANKTGTISILSDSYSTLGVLLSLPSGMISTASEKGLLGLAFTLILKPMVIFRQLQPCRNQLHPNLEIYSC